MQEWLKNKKHIRTITRDRATAYAKVIETELPNVMQVAERFHLHQNLLETIRTCLRRELPSSIGVPQDELDSLERTQSKKKLFCRKLFKTRRKKETIYSTNSSTFKRRGFDIRNCKKDGNGMFNHCEVSRRRS